MRRKPGVFALADLRLDLCAHALLARDDCAQRARRDRGHRSILLLRWQILHELAISFFQLRIRVELFEHACANALATVDPVDVLQHEHSFEPLSR